MPAIDRALGSSDHLFPPPEPRFSLARLDREVSAPLSLFYQQDGWAKVSADSAAEASLRDVWRRSATTVCKIVLSTALILNTGIALVVAHQVYAVSRWNGSAPSRAGHHLSLDWMFIFELGFITVLNVRLIAIVIDTHAQLTLSDASLAAENDARQRDPTYIEALVFYFSRARVRRHLKG